MVYKARIKLLNTARSLLPDERIAECSRKPVPLQSHVQVKFNTDHKSAFFRHLELCDSYACPMCAPRRSEQDRIKLAVALAEGEKLGLFPYLATFTMSHTHGDELPDLMGKLGEAFDRVFSGRWYQNLKAEYGIVGKVKAWEVTYGDNGWHPHMHVILFAEMELTGQWLDQFAEGIKTRWQARLGALGAFASLAHGVDVKAGNSAVADYIAKHGREPLTDAWGLESEIAKAPTKTGRRDGLTPFELLAAAGDDSGLLGALGALGGLGKLGQGELIARAGRLYVEYFQTFKGRSRLHWSKGLQERLGLQEALERFEAENSSEAKTVVMFEIERGANWWSVVNRDLRADLLIAARTGNIAHLARWAADNGIVGLVPHETIAVCDPDGNVTISPSSPSAAAPSAPSASAEHVQPVDDAPSAPAAPSAAKKGEAAQQPAAAPSAAPAAPSAPKRADPDVPHELPFFDAVEGKKRRFVYA